MRVLLQLNRSMSDLFKRKLDKLLVKESSASALWLVEMEMPPKAKLKTKRRLIVSVQIIYKSSCRRKNFKIFE